MQTRQPNYLPWYPFSPPFCKVPRTLPNSFIITTQTTSCLLTLLPRLGCCRSSVSKRHGKEDYFRHSPGIGHGYFRLPPLLPLPSQAIRGHRLRDGQSDRPNRQTDTGARNANTHAPTHPHSQTHNTTHPSPGRLAPSSRRVARSPGTAHDSSPGVGTEYGVQGRGCHRPVEPASS